MDHKEVGHFWNTNADAWTTLSRAGYDVYRDYLNTPAFFEMLPDVAGRSGLDLGCGEGHNTRLLARRGAKLHDIDHPTNSLEDLFLKTVRESAARPGQRYTPEDRSPPAK